MTDLLIDLASDALGGRVLEANDDFFAPKENLVKASEPVWDADRYTDRGKWMDGWETRRRRTPGHDWAVVALGRPGIVRAVLIDTANFTGNYPEQASVEAIGLPGQPNIVELVRDRSRWTEIVPKSALQGDSKATFEVDHDELVTHVRLVIYPDGGVARLRVLGETVPAAHLLDEETIDLARIENGARAIDCSDRHYSSPNNMLRSGDSKGMFDGWETKRRRGPGHDWSVIRLAGRSTVTSLVVDTTHFKGNAPGWVDVERAVSHGTPNNAAWEPLLERTEVGPDRKHQFDVGPAEATHLRLNIHPDGGVARFRAHGKLHQPWTSTS